VINHRIHCTQDESCRNCLLMTYVHKIGSASDQFDSVFHLVPRWTIYLAENYSSGCEVLRDRSRKYLSQRALHSENVLYTAVDEQVIQLCGDS